MNAGVNSAFSDPPDGTKLLSGFCAEHLDGLPEMSIVFQIVGTTRNERNPGGDPLRVRE
jgi:hypothetical protein